MICRAAVIAVLTLIASYASAAPASGDPVLRASYSYIGRADPRLCPSPHCGGLWVRAVNKVKPRCAEPVRRECYVASANFGSLPVGETARNRLAALFAEGRALVVAQLARGQVEGFPELGVLNVSEVWPASRSLRKPAGVFRLLQDNGVRCVTTPCFSTSATALNTERELTVSNVDLSGTGASSAERRRALTQTAKGRLIASGLIVLNRNAGPAGPGRTLVASQFYVRAYP